MSPILIAIVTAIYAVCAILEARATNYGLAIFLGGCSVANVGIIMMAKG